MIYGVLIVRLKLGSRLFPKIMRRKEEEVTQVSYLDEGSMSMEGGTLTISSKMRSCSISILSSGATQIST